MESKLKSTLVALHIYERYRIRLRACQLLRLGIDLCHVTDSRCKINGSIRGGTYNTLVHPHAFQYRNIHYKDGLSPSENRFS
jgi:hypothetical protein